MIPPDMAAVAISRTRDLATPRLPRAAPPKLPVGWSRNGVPLVPEYERCDY